MSRWTTDRKISYGFCAAFALLATLPLFIYHQKSRLLESSRWVSHTYQVIAELESTQLALSDAETGQRGFIITGREEYLAPYKLAVSTTKDHIARLSELTIDPESLEELPERIARAE